jgi:DNA-directed RNA polymerase subunit K/omega
MEEQMTKNLFASYPVFAIDCEPFVPNRYVLVRAAGMRTRELRRGAAPRVEAPTTNCPQIALAEIAAGAFEGAELARLLGLDRPAGEAQTIEIDLPDEVSVDEQQVLDGMARSLAAAPARQDERLDSLK